MVVTSVTMMVVGSVVAGSLTEVFTGSLIIPSHSSPLSSVSLGASVVSVVVSVGAGVCGTSSAKADEAGGIMAIVPTKIRPKNNLTIFLIIFYYIILCLKQQEVV